MRAASIALIAGFCLGSAPARADYVNRLELGAGILTMNNPSQTSFEASVEFEHRLDPMWGLGASGNYVFSSPGIALIAVPDVFLHPFEGEFLVSAAPLFEFGSATGTNVGVKLGTRIPLPLGAITLIPELGIDFIYGGPIYVFGIGIQF